MNEKTKRKIEFIVNIFYAALVVGIIYLVYKYVLGLLMPFIIAFILVSILNPFIRKLHKYMKINQKILSVLIMALLYIGTGTLIFLGIMQIIFFLKDIFGMLPEYYKNTIEPVLTSIIDGVTSLLDRLPASWSTGFDTIQGSLLSGVQNLTETISKKSVSIITGFINGIPSFVMALIFTIMLSFFISLQYEKVVLVIKNQIPEKGRMYLREVRGILKNTIFKYIKAYLILMSITFVELSVGFLIIGTTNAIAVAAGIAVFDALPVFGTGGIMIPWIIIEGVQGNFSYAVSLGIIYGVVTVIRNIIEPKVVGDQLGINPIVSLVSIYLGFRLFGVLGMITFPMLTQILLVLHQKGTIHIYKEENEEKKGKIKEEEIEDSKDETKEETDEKETIS